MEPPHRTADGRQRRLTLRNVALALLLLTAACGSSDSNSTPAVVVTSSTTAEEAKAIDGPLMRYPQTSSPSANLGTLLTGVLQLDAGCLYLVQANGQRYPILWPAGTRWDDPNRSVVSPAGEVMPMGGQVEGRGGFFFLSDVQLLGGTAASNLAASCVDNSDNQVAVTENVDTAIGPKAA